MRNILALTLFLIGIVTNTSGCPEPPSPLTAQERLNNSADLSITKAILDNITDDKYKIDYRSNIIFIKQYISGELGSMSSSLKEALLNYSSLYDSSTDQIAKTYIEVAKKRGHSVKLYRENMNSKISKVLPITLDINEESSHMNLDSALVEYDRDSRIKSVVIRVHSIYKHVGWVQYRYTLLIFGDMARFIESKIKKSVFDDLYITTVK